MATSRMHGPLGLSTGQGEFRDQCQRRFRGCLPGPLGVRETSTLSTAPAFPTHPFVTATNHARRLNLPVLRLGSQGIDVRRLQRQLNARLMPPWRIAADGVFGPNTCQAVVAYQKGVSIRSDGIVGAQTWYHLLKGAKPGPLPPAPLYPTAGAATPRTAPQAARLLSPSTDDIWKWTVEKKFAEALRRTAPRLPADMRHEFEMLISPTSLTITAGTLVAWGAAHAFGVGVIVDILLLVGGVLFLGLAVFEVAAELSAFFALTTGATESQELDEAAAHLARAVTITGVAAFVALLAKVARSRGSGRDGGVASGKNSRTVPETPKVNKPSPSQKSPASPSAKVTQQGGRHAGFLKNYQNKTPAEIRKGIASLEKQIREHQAKIANPEKAIPNFRQLDPRQQKALVESKWPSDIQRQQEQQEILQVLLRDN